MGQRIIPTEDTDSRQRHSGAKEAVFEGTKVEVLELSPEDSRIFVDALLDPPEPSPALKRAFERHRKMVISE